MHLVALAALIAAMMTIPAFGENPPAPATQPASQPAKPAGNLDYWLNQAKEVQPTSQAQNAPQGANPFDSKDRFYRDDALPGVLELSDGTRIPGWHYTTVEKDWEVYIESEKRWRLVPFIDVLSITAVVREERMEQRWRWKEMGAPEKIYTGKQYPYRRFEWRFFLIDGTTLTGAVKGQPLWVEHNRKKTGPLVFHERLKGEDDQTLDELVYIKKVVISRKMMDAVLAEQAVEETRKGKTEK